MPKPDHPILFLANTLAGTFLLVFSLFIIPWTVPALSLTLIVLGVLFLAGAAALLCGSRQRAVLLVRTGYQASIACGVLLGLLLVSAASYMAGVYESFGKTVAGVFLFLLAFILLLLVVLPLIGLCHLRREARSGNAGTASNNGSGDMRENRDAAGSG